MLPWGRILVVILFLSLGEEEKQKKKTTTKHSGGLAMGLCWLPKDVQSAEKLL